MGPHRASAGGCVTHRYHSRVPTLTPGAGRAGEWLQRGSFFDWAPTTGPAAGREVRVFHVEAGPPDAPVMLLIHGFPTSSIDWYDVIDLLSETYRVSALDFPGYGFSDKPPDWPYSLELDAELVLHHLGEVLGADSCRIVAHDRGDSVALVVHDMVCRSSPEFETSIEHLVLSNGNIFLPLANLTTFQKLILDETRAKEVLDVLTADMLAAGLGASTFTPSRHPGDPTIEALKATFDHNDGISVLSRTVQYLRERADHEVGWLKSLAASEVPSTVVWGVCDTVSPPRVPMHVWEHYLRAKPGSNELWLIPDANHYVQNDRPEVFAEVVLSALERDGPAVPGPIQLSTGSAIRIDHSSAQMTDPKSAFVI